MNRRDVLALIVGVFMAGWFMTMPHNAMAENSPKVTMVTSKGKMVIELDSKAAPITVKNFLDYVAEGFYNGTVFHRVISNFMIQGGGFTPDMHTKSTKAQIKNEANNGLSNLRGTIAMARTNQVDSATSQFFINVVDNKSLDYKGPNNYGYAVFGKVIDGMDVVDKIRGVPTTTKGGHQNVPQESVVIKSVTLEK